MEPNIRVSMGKTTLHNAVCNGHTEVVRLLLDNRADPNIKDWRGRAQIHDAARYGHADVVQVLLSRGADPNIKDRFGDLAEDFIKDRFGDIAEERIPISRIIKDYREKTATGSTKVGASEEEERISPSKKRKIN